MVKNKYPVYIISKGRYEKPLTANRFDSYGIDYLSYPRAKSILFGLNLSF